MRKIFDEEGDCYRGVLRYFVSKNGQNEEKVQMFGPYSRRGDASGAITYWVNNYMSHKSTFVVIERYVEAATEWTRV